MVLLLGRPWFQGGHRVKCYSSSNNTFTFIFLVHLYTENKWTLGNKLAQKRTKKKRLKSAVPVWMFVRLNCIKLCVRACVRGGCAYKLNFSSTITAVDPAVQVAQLIEHPSCPVDRPSVRKVRGYELWLGAYVCGTPVSYGSEASYSYTGHGVKKQNIHCVLCHKIVSCFFFFIYSFLTAKPIVCP